MAGYSTGAPELLTAAQQMMDSNDALSGELNSLLGKLESLQGAWAGEAATAFHNLLERYASDAKRLNDNLVSISERVTGTAHAYTQQEQEQSQSLSALTQALG